jgi:CBS domain-containing protein
MTTGRRHLAAPPETLDQDRVGAGPLIGDPLISTVMTTRVVAITPDATVLTAMALMASAGVRHLPVISGDRCRGVLHETDVIGHLAVGPVPGIDAAATPVDRLSRPAVSVPESARRSDAARRMADDGGDAVIVIGRYGLVGIVTATDLIRSLAGEARHV